jgi:hypothetical protein
VLDDGFLSLSSARAAAQNSSDLFQHKRSEEPKEVGVKMKEKKKQKRTRRDL